MKKKFLVALAAVMINAVTVFASSSTNLMINGHKVILEYYSQTGATTFIAVEDVESHIGKKIEGLPSRGDITYMPIRELAKLMKATVAFDNATKTINLTTSDAVEIPIAEPKEEVKEEIKSLKPVSIDDFGNAFKGRLGDARYKNVIVAKPSTFPIQIGRKIIHGISFDGTSIIVKISYDGGDWTAGRVYISDKDGLARARDAYKESKDNNGIITAFYGEKNAVDQLYDSDYKNYTVNKINYFVFADGDTLLAIPRGEVIK